MTVLAVVPSIRPWLTTENSLKYRRGSAEALVGPPSRSMPHEPDERRDGSGLVYPSVETHSAPCQRGPGAVPRAVRLQERAMFWTPVEEALP